MKSAITISLVAEARQGPFVLHAEPTLAGLEAACRVAAEIGFDAVEIFPAGPEALDWEAVRRLLATHGLALAAMGTGAGWVKHGLQLCHADAEIRRRAREFIAGIIAAAAGLGAPAIIGSMQGRSEERVPRDAALEHLGAALAELGARAGRHGQPLLYEPLNRYETNLFTRQAEAAAFLDARGVPNVKLLCDLFHMNIEEADLAGALVACGGRVGHVHWADSNRHAIGFGHTDTRPVIAVLRQIGYSGYLSAEVFPLPDELQAARQSLAAFRNATRI
jgi:sugar phosphate isomerase/epimerase